MAGRNRLVTVPFALGQDEEQSPRELPAGPLREAVNVRQRHGSAFGVRADYPTISLTEYGGNMVPYDLYNLNGKLICLGDRQLEGRVTDIFEFVQETVSSWKGTVPPGASGRRIPAATRFRNMGQPPDGIADANYVRVSAINGLVCMVFGAGSANPGSTTNLTYVHIFDPDGDSTVVFKSLPIANAKTVALGNSFWIIGVNSVNDLVGHRYDTTTNSSLQTAVTLYTGTVTSNKFDCCPVGAATVAEFATVVNDGATTTIRRFNEAGVQQQTFAGPAVTTLHMALEADSVANQIVLAYNASGTDVVVQTFNLTTAASVVGPTNFYSTTMTGDIALVRGTTGGVSLEMMAEDDTLIVRRSFFTGSTHSRSNRNLNNYILGGKGVSANSSSDVIFPMQSQVTAPSGSSPIPNQGSNQLIEVFTSLDVQPIATVDVGIAIDGREAGTQAMGGSVCKDLTTGRYYWGRLIVGTDTQTIPVVGEFFVDDTARRQACQIGNELFISGSMPLSYDGRQVVESGFSEAPIFASLVAGGVAGGLIEGAEYDYCAIYSWTDSQGRKCRSPVSAIQTITATSTESTISSIYAPHTLRRDIETGSAPTIELYRTFGVVETVAAEIQSTRDFGATPATVGDFNGLTLIISVDGGGNQTVTFGAADNTAPELVSAINTQTTGCTAALNDNFITITSDAIGSAGSVSVTGGTTTSGGIGSTGFTVGQTSTGITTFTKGTVFQLAETQAVATAVEWGGIVALTDVTTDTFLLTQESLYTQGERGSLTGVKQNDTVPPCRYCWTVGNRILLGGLPDPSQVQISKALFPAETIAFSDDFAFVGFVDGSVTGVAGLDGIPIVFTADAIYRFSPQFPDDNGGNGQLDVPQKIPSEGGSNNYSSFLETSLGLFYQARDTKLMLLPRGGAAPVWIGRRIQDTLTAFPNIVGAAYSDIDNCALFTCQNTAGTASVILVFDLRVQQWYTDTFASAQVIKACVGYSGRLAYIDGVTIRQQSLSLTPASFIPMNAKTGSLAPFGGNGCGQMPQITIKGEKRGDALIRCRISYDDGVTFTNLKTFSITTAAGYTTGETFQLQWYPARRKGDAFVLDFQVLDAGGGTEGLIINSYTLELIGAPLGRVLLSTAERG